MQGYLSMNFIGVNEGSIHTSSKNGKITREYRTWHNLLVRLTNKKELERYPRYKDCKLCYEWYNFNNFAEWAKDNYYEVEDELMCLDKDILIKNNKIYSPETCIFVPNSINVLFTKSNKARGDCPIGVYYEKDSGKFKSQLSYQDSRGSKRKRKNLGRFSTKEEAFLKYKNEKEKYIKIVANRYKDEIPKKLYDAMYGYEVEMGD